MYNFITYLCVLLFLATGNLSAIAQEASSGLDRSPSVDTAASSTPTETPSVSPEPTRPGAQTSYVYDLKRLIDQSRNNIKNVNEKIKEQSVVKRNQKREEKAREYYEYGQKLADEGKLDQAREYFEKAIRITEHPEMTGYIKQSQKRLKAQEDALRRQESQFIRQEKEQDKSHREDVAIAYDEAVALYREKKYREAKDGFEHVQEMIADYKATQSYLKIIDQDIVAIDQMSLKQQKVEMDRQQKEAEVARSREKELWRRELDQKEQQRKGQLSKQADEVYVQAVDLYKQKKFKEAKSKFQEVALVFPDYKATNNYLKRVDGDIDIYNKEQAIEQEKLLAKQRWEDEVAKIKQDKERKIQLESQEKARVKQLEEEAAFTYDAAITLFDKGVLDQALEKFNDIEKTVPGYKSTRIYIAKIAKLKLDNQRKEEEQKAKDALAKLKIEDEKRKLEENKKKAEEEFKQNTLKGQVEVIYNKALSDWKSKNYPAAKEGFIKVNQQWPDYKETAKYLATVDEMIVQFNLQQERQYQLEVKRQQLLHIKEATVKAERLYQQGILLYKKNDLVQAKDSFQQVAAIFPDFKDTKKYLEELSQKLNQPIVIPPKESILPPPVLPKPPEPQSAAVVVPPLVVPPVAVEQPISQEVVQQLRPVIVQTTRPALTASSMEDQMSEAQEIADLAEKSHALMRQLSSVSEDKNTAVAKRKLNQFNQMINEVKEQKERSMRQAREQMLRAEQEKLKAQEEIREQRAQEIYQMAIEKLHQQDFENAKRKLLELENISSNYKNTRQLLAGIENDKAKAEQLAQNERNSQEQTQLQEIQQKAQVEVKERELIEKRRQAELRRNQEEQIQSLSRRAIDINDEVIALTKQKQYTAVKTKLAELEGVVASIKALKDIIDQQDQHVRAKELQTKEMMRLKREANKASREEKRQVVGAGLQEQEHRMTPQKFANENAEQFRRREAERQADMLYNQGVELYERRKYTQARLIFEELRKRKDRRAPGWISKLEHVVNNEVIKYKKEESRQQTDFIADRIRMQKKVDAIEEKEQIRRRKLANEFERQKQLSDDQRQEQRRRQEAMRAQEQERLRREREEESINKERRQQEEVFRFRKLNQTKPAAKEQVKNGLSEKEQAQIELSKKRKAYFDEQALKKQEEEKKQELANKPLPVIQEEKRVIKPAGVKVKPIKSKQIQELKDQDQSIADRKSQAETRKQEALKRQQELLKLRKENELKVKQAKQEELRKRDEERLKAIELKRKQAEELIKLRAQKKKDAEIAKQQAIQLKIQQQTEALKQQEQKKKEAEVARIEAQRQSDLEAQMKVRQVKFEEERAKIRRQMEAETDAIYQQGMVLYKSGQYKEAIVKFQDCEDVLPGYKQSQDYLNKAKSALTKPVDAPVVKAKAVPVAKKVKAKKVAKSQKVESTTATSTKDLSSDRAEAIKKTLDLFDPDVK